MLLTDVKIFWLFTFDYFIILMMNSVTLSILAGRKKKEISVPDLARSLF